MTKKEKQNPGLKYEIPFEAQRLINLSLSQSRILNREDESSFEIDIEELMRQTD